MLPSKFLTVEQQHLEEARLVKLECCFDAFAFVRAFVLLLLEMEHSVEQDYVVRLPLLLVVLILPVLLLLFVVAILNLLLETLYAMLIK